MQVVLKKRWNTFLDRVAYRKYQVKSSSSRVYQKLRPATLSIFGLSSFTTAAFQISGLVGFIVLGISFFALEWRLHLEWRRN